MPHRKLVFALWKVAGEDRFPRGKIPMGKSALAEGALVSLIFIYLYTGGRTSVIGKIYKIEDGNV